MCYVCMCPREGREVTSLGLEVMGSCELPDLGLGTSAVLGRSLARAASAVTLNLCSPATVILLFQPPCPFQNHLFFAVFSFLRDGLCSPGWPGNSLCLASHLQPFPRALGSQCVPRLACVTSGPISLDTVSLLRG